MSVVDPRCPGEVESALIKAGWHYAGPHKGWSNDHVQYFMCWELPVSRIIIRSAPAAVPGPLAMELPRVVKAHVEDLRRTAQTIRASDFGGHFKRTADEIDKAADELTEALRTAANAQGARK